MRILLKCPTRSRPQKILSTVASYIRLANARENIGIAISCDDDDMSMKRNLVQEELMNVTRSCGWSRVFYSPNKSKIEACNANMAEIEYPWDIVVLVSDDMIPQIQGWDDVIRNHMIARFPDTDGILWCNDGFQGENLNTLCVYGRKMYERLGNLYEPMYKSLFCDTELTDRCRGDLKNKCIYIPYCIIRHEHPGTGFAQNNDALYQKNQRYWNEDMMTYIRRKAYPFDWSVLIPTMPGREDQLHTLCKSIHEKVNRIAPDMKIEICLDFDNRESTIGAKRQRLLERASGKYLSFIDDDDEITDAYIEDLRDCMAGNHQVMRLRGDMKGYPFIHTTNVKLTDAMATMDEPAIFMRPPNHLNPMMSDIAKLIKFQHIDRYEDLEWTIRMFHAGFLRDEYRSDELRTHYNYKIRNRDVGQATIDYQRKTTYAMMTRGVTAQAPASGSEIQNKDRRFRLGSRGFVST